MALWRIFLKWVSLGAGLWLVLASATSFAYQWGWDGRYIYGENLSLQDVRLFKELICLPDRLWVNLSPTLSPEQVLPGRLWAGQVGRILLDADLELKKLAKEVIEERLDWEEEVSFRVVIFIRRCELDLYKNGRAVGKIRLGVKIFAEDKEWERRFNTDVAPYVEQGINSSPEFSDLRRLVGLYALSRTGKCHPLDRVFMGQEWNDKDGALEEYRELFEEGVVGGVEIDSKNFEERFHPKDPLPTGGKRRIALTGTADSEHKKILFMAKEKAKENLARLNRLFLPEERWLRDLIPLRIVDAGECAFPPDKQEGVYAFSVRELGSRFTIFPIELLNKIWAKTRRRYWREIKNQLKEEISSAADVVDPRGEYLWSVEGGIDGGAVQVYQIRPVGRVKETEADLLEEEEFKQRLLRALKRIEEEGLGEHAIDLKDTISAVKEGRLKEGADSVLTQLWTTYSKDREIGKNFVKVIRELPEEDEKVFWDWLLLFPTTGKHFSVSLLLDAISWGKGEKFLTNRVMEVLRFGEELGQSGLEELGKCRFGSGKNEGQKGLGNEPLFGLAGAIVLWPALFGKDNGVRERYLRFLSLCKEQLGKREVLYMVEKVNRFLGLGNESFFEMLDRDIKRQLQDLGIGMLKQKRPVMQERHVGHKGQRHHVVLENLSFSLVTKGKLGNTVMGRIRIVKSPEDVYKIEDGDILVVESLPTNYPQIEGLPSCIMVLEDVVEGQHVALYVKQMGLPLVRLRGDYSLEEFESLEDTWVKLYLPKGEIRLAKREEGISFIENTVLPYKRGLIEKAKSSTALFREEEGFPMEVVIANLRDTLRASVFGAKAARLSTLIHAGVRVPEGIAVSLGLLRWVLDRVEFDWTAWKREFERSVQSGRVSNRLRSMAQDIQRKIVDVSLKEILDRLWVQLGDLREKELIVRSVSSMEDRRLAPFVGTGVLESVRVEQVDRKRLARAIKQVLASMFSLNSLVEKVSLGIDPTDVGMGVIIQQVIIEDVGFVGEFGEGEMRIDVVLGNNSVITAQGNRMGTGIDFPWSDRFVFHPTVGRKNRLKKLFSNGDLYVKALRFWREVMVSIYDWSSETERLAWIELWNRLLMSNDGDLISLIKEDYQDIFRSLKKQENRLDLEDKLLLHYLPFAVLHRRLPEGMILEDILKNGLTSVDISALQVIAKVRPDLFSLNQLERWIKGEGSIDKQRLAVNLIWYVSDPDGVIRRVKLGGDEEKKKGGIELDDSGQRLN